MKLTLALTASVLIPVAAWIAGILSAAPSLVIMGGEHTLHTGDIIDGDLMIIFADLKLEPGAQVCGNIASFSSTIHTQGLIQGDLFSLDGEITAAAPADLSGDQHVYDILPFDVLLPAIARVNLESTP